MSRRAAALLLLGLAVAAGGLLFLARRPASEPAARRRLPFLRESPAAGTAAPIPGRGAPGVESIRVTLFFADSTQGRLHPEERDIPRPASPGAFLRSLFDELARGPASPGLVGVVPPRIQLRADSSYSTSPSTPAFRSGPRRSSRSSRHWSTPCSRTLRTRST
jgi:hypothetical protein